MSSHKSFTRFFEKTYKNVLITRQEIIFIRSNNDLGAVLRTEVVEKSKIILNKFVRNVPSIVLSETQKFKSLQYNERGRDLPKAS